VNHRDKPKKTLDHPANRLDKPKKIPVHPVNRPDRVERSRGLPVVHRVNPKIKVAHLPKNPETNQIMVGISQMDKNIKWMQ
jgi:hypothetical protein